MSDVNVFLVQVAEKRGSQVGIFPGGVDGEWLGDELDLLLLGGAFRKLESHSCDAAADERNERSGPARHHQHQGQEADDDPEYGAGAFIKAADLLFVHVGDQEVMVALEKLGGSAFLPFDVADDENLVAVAQKRLGVAHALVEEPALGALAVS